MKLKLVCIILATALFLVGAAVGTLVPIGADDTSRCPEDAVSWWSFEPGQDISTGRECVALDNLIAEETER